MNVRTMWLLLVAVLCAGGLVVWLAGREQQQASAPTSAQLFEHAAPGSIVSFAIDVLRRDEQIEVALDPETGWRIVDPFQAPADSARVERLLSDVLAAVAEPSPFDDLERLGLAPPRIVLTVVSAVRTPGGKLVPQSQRVEIGEPTLDGQGLYVRTADGAVRRTQRNLETSTDQRPADWLSMRLIEDPPTPTAVVELERRGALVNQGGSVSLDLRAVLEPTGWKATEPRIASLDPGFCSLLAGAPAVLRALQFVRDDEHGPQELGFDDPTFTLAVSGPAKRAELAFVATESAGVRGWLARGSEGRLATARVESEQVERFALPFELLVDKQFTRVLRKDIERLTLAVGARELHLEPAGKLWRVGPPDEPARTRALADPERVDALFSELELLRFPDRVVERAFEPSEPPVAIALQTPAGTFTAELGAAVQLEDGARGRLFRRRGEEVVLLAPTSFFELVTETDVDALRSRTLHTVREEEVARIAIDTHDAQRAWHRDGRTGRWLREHGADPDPAFELLVDRLRIVRAERFLPPLARDEAAEDVGPLEGSALIAIERTGGGAIEFRLDPFDAASESDAGIGADSGADSGSDSGADSGSGASSAPAAVYRTPELRARVAGALLSDVLALFEE